MITNTMTFASDAVVLYSMNEFRKPVQTPRSRCP